MDKSVYRYVPGTDVDYVLLNWFNRMVHDGELTHTLSSAVRAPGQFLQFFLQRPLLYKIDSLYNITHAAWMEPCMGSVFLSYYVAPGSRGMNKEKGFFLYDVIDAVFVDGANTVCGIVKERATRADTKRIIEVHEFLGYTYSGRVKHFFDGADAHLVAITKDEWAALNSAYKRAWARNRQRGETVRQSPSQAETLFVGA